MKNCKFKDCINKVFTGKCESCGKSKLNYQNSDEYYNDFKETIDKNKN